MTGSPGVSASMDVASTGIAGAGCPRRASRAGVLRAPNAPAVFGGPAGTFPRRQRGKTASRSTFGSHQGFTRNTTTGHKRHLFVGAAAGLTRPGFVDDKDVEYRSACGLHVPAALPLLGHGKRRGLRSQASRYLEGIGEGKVTRKGKADSGKGPQISYRRRTSGRNPCVLSCGLQFLARLILTLCGIPFTAAQRQRWMGRLYGGCSFVLRRQQHQLS